MWHLVYHYLYQDIYQPVWSNWVAGGIAAPIAFFWGKAFEKRAILRHNDMKRHISAEHQKSREHLEAHIRSKK